MKMDKLFLIKKIKQAFCLHDYVLADSKTRIIYGINYICRKCGKKSLFDD